jgi:hypothetical protein
MEDVEKRIEKLEENLNVIFLKLQKQIDEIKDKLREREVLDE